MGARHFMASMLAAVSLATVSHAATPPGGQVAVASPTAAVDFEVFLPLRDKPALQALLAAQQTPGSASYHRWLTPAQFGARFGPTAASLANVRAALAGAGLRATATHTRSLHVAGTVDQANRLLQTTLNAVTLANGHTHLVASKPITLPASLKQQGAVIVAFTGLPEKHTNARRVAGSVDPDNRQSAYGGYWFDDLKQAYDYPSYQSVLPSGARLDGTGVNIAILMDGNVLNSDLAKYFNHEHFTDTTGLAPPAVAFYPVDGGAPAFPGADSVEASLDVQMAQGGAPGASVTVVTVPNLSDQYLMDAYVAIVDANTWDVVNSSFGGCELQYLPAYNYGVNETEVLIVYDEVFAQGNAEGITFVASSGDEGALGCPSPGYADQGLPGKFLVGVESPADDPHVTAVGGGNIETTTPPSQQTRPPTLTSAYVAENAIGDPEIPYDPYGFGANVSGGYWGGTGGRSVIFGLPAYQNWLAFYGEGAGGRVVPDIGMQVGGCPFGISEPSCPVATSSYVFTVWDGQYIGLIGTSVSSPEFVGALALAIEAGGGRVGNVNTYLWSQGYVQVDLGGDQAAPSDQFFHKNQPGKDGAYFHFSTVGFDYMYGNGSPDLRKLFGLTGFAAAGDPQTPSNP